MRAILHLGRAGAAAVRRMGREGPCLQRRSQHPLLAHALLRVLELGPGDGGESRGRTSRGCRRASTLTSSRRAARAGEPVRAARRSAARHRRAGRGARGDRTRRGAHGEQRRAAHRGRVVALQGAGADGRPAARAPGAAIAELRRAVDAAERQGARLPQLRALGQLDTHRRRAGEDASADERRLAALCERFAPTPSCPTCCGRGGSSTWPAVAREQPASGHDRRRRHRRGWPRPCAWPSGDTR